MRSVKSVVGREVFFVMATVFLILISALCITLTVMGKSSLAQEEKDAYYRQKEQQLVKEVRTYLDESGYHNSGVMLTHVTYGDGSREYTVTVHHAGINELGSEERENLAKQLQDFDFQDESCTFNHEFMKN